MKKILEILILVSFISCNSSKRVNKTVIAHNTNKQPETYALWNSELSSTNLTTYIGLDTTIVKYYETGTIQSKTTFAIDNKGKVSNLQVGVSESYNELNHLVEKGNYVLGEYTNCCTDGPCKQFYSYKIGKWKYFYPNGSLKAIVQYETTDLKMDTSCDGGAYLKFGKVNLNKSVFYNSKRKRINPSIKTIAKYETVHYDMNEFQRIVLSIKNGKIIGQITMK